MLLLRKFNKKEILEIVAKYACESLPENSHGVVDAKFNKKNEIEVYFIQNSDSTEILS